MYIFSIFPMAQLASIYVKYLKADLAKMKNAVSIGIYNPYTKMKS